MEWILIAAVIGATVAFFCLQHLRCSSQLKLPPGPPGVLVFGNLLSVFVNSKAPHRELFRLSRIYGPIMSIRLGTVQAIVVTSPDLAREVLKVQDKNFASRHMQFAADQLAYRDSSLGFCPYGSHLIYIRRILLSELLHPRRLRQFQESRVDEVARMINSIFHQSQSREGTEQGINVHQMTCFLTLNIVTRLMFSKRFFEYGSSSQADVVGDKGRFTSEQAVEFEHMLEEFLRIMGTPVVGDFVTPLKIFNKLTTIAATMRKSHDRVDKFFHAIIEERRRDRSNPEAVQRERDLLDILLDQPGENGDSHLKDFSMKGMLLDMLLAGTDTSSITVEWALCELVRFPHILEKVQNELDSVVGKDRLVMESDISNLPYLTAVVKENFRLHPAVAMLIPHKTINACKLAGYDVPAKSVVYVNVFGMGRDPDLWESPCDFLPERFLNSNLEWSGQDFELLPFGSGRRKCPGMHLGILMVQYPLARLVQAFNWRLTKDENAEDMDMSEVFGATYPRAQNLIAIPTPRLATHLY